MTDVTTPALRDGSPYAAFDPASDHLEVTAYADGVVLVALTWPERRNAMGLAMTDAWVRLVDVLRADPELRVVVLTGAGTIFSSGGDTSWITSEPDATVGDLRLRMIGYYDAWLTVRTLEVPARAGLPPVPFRLPFDWHADPLGTHAWRWWDGSSWTDHFSDAPTPPSTNPRG